MERAQEINKLVNVLRRIGRSAGYAAVNAGDPGAIRFCVNQYNKVLSRFLELEPSIAGLFTLLPESSAAEVIQLAAGELAAYFEDESRSEHRRHRWGCGPRVVVGYAPFRRHF
jgi:hypothetical protein